MRLVKRIRLRNEILMRVLLKNSELAALDGELFEGAACDTILY